MLISSGQEADGDIVMRPIMTYLTGHLINMQAALTSEDIVWLWQRSLSVLQLVTSSSGALGL